MAFTQTVINLMNRIAAGLARREEGGFAVEGVPGCWHTTTLTTQLPASVEGTYFEAELALRWQIVSKRDLESAPESLVRAQAARIVRGCTANALVTQVQEVEAEANQYLAVLQGPGLFGQGKVTLTVNDEHKEATRLHQELTYRLRNNELERRVAADEREHLRSQIFTDRQTALLWWIQKVPNAASTLKELDALLNYYHGNHGPTGADEASELHRLQSRLLRLDEASREYLLRQFQTLIDAVAEDDANAA